MFNLSGLVNNIASSALGGLFGGLMGDQSIDPAYCVKIYGNNGATSITAALPETFSSSVGSDYDMPFADGLANLMSSALGASNFENVKLGARMLGGSTSTQSMSMQVWNGTEPMNFSIPIQFLMNTDPYNDIILPMRSLMKLTLPSSSNSAGITSAGNTLTGTEGMLISPGPKLKLKSGTTTADVTSRMMSGVTSVGTLVKEGASVLMSGEGADWAENGGAKKLGDKLFGNSLFSILDIHDNISLALGHFYFFPSVVITDVSSDYGIKLDAQTKLPIELSATVSFRTFVTPKAEDVDTMLLG